jgi:hypothetical protein
MNKIKSLGFVFISLAILLVLIVIRANNKNLFRNNTSSAIIAGLNNSISFAELNTLDEKTVIFQFNNSKNLNSFTGKKVYPISYENLLDKETREILDNAEGSVLLFAENIEVSSKALILLNQLGYKQVFILVQEENHEVLKYKFQPDTTARLE